MICADVRHQLLEGGDTERRGLDAHLSTCPECRHLADVLQAREAELHEALDAFEHRAPDDAWRRARAATDPEPHRRWSLLDAPLHTALALAAAAALALTGVWSALPSLTPDAPQTATETPAGGVDWAAVEEVVSATAALPWSAVSERDWAMRAKDLHTLWTTTEAAPPAEREAHREQRLRLAAAWGRAAENANVPAPPHYVHKPEFGLVNAGFWEAARIALLLDRPVAVRTTSAPTSIRAYMAQQRGDPGTFPAYQAEQAVAGVRTTPWNAMSEDEWSEAAWGLRDACIDLWPALSRSPDLAPLALQCVSQLGRSAENANRPGAPFYREVDGQHVNYYWSVAASLLATDPGLASELTDVTLRQSVERYLTLIDAESTDVEVPTRLD